MFVCNVLIILPGVIDFHVDPVGRAVCAVVGISGSVEVMGIVYVSRKVTFHRYQPFMTIHHVYIVVMSGMLTLCYCYELSKYVYITM